MNQSTWLTTDYVKTCPLQYQFKSQACNLLVYVLQLIYYNQIKNKIKLEVLRKRDPGCIIQNHNKCISLFCLSFQMHFTNIKNSKRR